MKDGDVAGLAVMQDPTAFIGISRQGRKRFLVHSTLSLRHKTKEETRGERIKTPVVYLRAVTDYRASKARFYYSTDNATYIPFGKELSMKFDLSVFTGNKFAIFNYATKALGGYVDIDWFSTEPEFSEEEFYGEEPLNYSEESLTLSRLTPVQDGELALLTGSTHDLELTAHYADGHTDKVAALAAYSDYDKDIIEITNGRIRALADGATSLTATYQGARGEERSCTINITASTFPMSREAFNPSIWEQGYFDEKKGMVKTGKYGFAGWRYDNGLDISKYKYLVVEIEGGEGANVSLRLFDDNNYWGDCAVYDFGNENRLVIPIAQLQRSRNKQRRFASEHVYILGFWSTGTAPFRIREIRLADKVD
jgi:hypothetical protein